LTLISRSLIIVPMVVTEPRPAGGKVDRLNAASLRTVIEPEERFDFDAIGTGQLIPDALLTVAGLDLRLTPEQKARLSREEIASMLAMGVAFEATLSAGFSWQIAMAQDVTDTRITYMLHEVGEETRHSRAFVRVVQELQPTATNPLQHPLLKRIERAYLPYLIKSPALLATMILAGEEIPDLLQKLASEHPDTDPVIAAVYRYHRLEEARHLAFARLTVGDLYRDAGAVERTIVRQVAPHLIESLFASVIHPGVYATVGLPSWRTWMAANRTTTRQAIKLAAFRPILAALVDGGVMQLGRIPAGWRARCQVDQQLRPLPGAPTLPATG
jgi:hypothetical protein